jgi:ABC-type Fe3+-siderophore transport system permease subunit
MTACVEMIVLDHEHGGAFKPAGAEIGQRLIGSSKRSRIFSVTGVNALVGDDFVTFIVVVLARQGRGAASCIRILLHVLACTAVLGSTRPMGVALLPSARRTP